jgi:hypothetical protein
MSGEYHRDISPITKINTIVYVKYKIEINKIYFGENRADVSVVVSDEAESNIKQIYYEIKGTDYINWSGDDYLTNWIKNKLRDEVF